MLIYLTLNLWFRIFKNQFVMKSKFALFIMIIVCIQVDAQDITIIQNYKVVSGKSISRDIPDLVALLKVDANHFENKMKSIGCQMSYNDDFCPVAVEQVKAEYYAEDTYIITKCPKFVSLLWYGPMENSGIKKIRDKLMPHFVGQKSDGDGFLFSIDNIEYLITVKRSSMDDHPEIAVEKLSIYYYNK